MSDTKDALPDDSLRAGTTEVEAIERFASLLEETGTGRHHRRPADVDPDLVRLVGLTQRLSAPCAPRPEFRAELLERLVAAHGQSRVPAALDEKVAPAPWPVNRTGPVAPRPRRGADDAAPAPGADDRQLANAKTQIVRVVRPRLGRRTRLAAVLGLTVGLAVSGVSMASGSAVPGDALYSVKNLGEQAQLWFAGSDADRGHLHLDFARARLVEAGQVGPDSIGAVLDAMDRETTEGARLLFTAGMSGGGASDIDAVATFVQQQRADLLQLRASVRTADDPTAGSLDLLNAVEIRANELRAALAGGCAVSSVDRFGPVPTC
jgi:hypothetical protein